MLNKKYYAYAVSLAIFSFSQLAAGITADVVDDLAVAASVQQELDVMVVKKLKEPTMYFVNRILHEKPHLGVRMYIAQMRAKNLLEATHQRKERLRQSVVSVPHELEIMLGVVNSSDEVFIIKSIDWAFELIWELLEQVKLQRKFPLAVATESIGRKRAQEFLDYCYTPNDIQDYIKKDIKTIGKLESVLGNMAQLLEDILFSVEPVTKEKINAVKAKITAMQPASNAQEVASVRDN